MTSVFWQRNFKVDCNDTHLITLDYSTTIDQQMTVSVTPGKYN